MKHTFTLVFFALLIIFYAALPVSADLGRSENGAVVENSTHVESRVNPKAGDFLWELEGKLAPKYPLQEGGKVVGRFRSEEGNV